MGVLKALRQFVLGGLAVLALTCGGGGSTGSGNPTTPDFSLGLAPPASIQAGGSGSATASVSRTGGHTAAITLSLQSNAQGITGGGTIATGAGSGALALTVPGTVAAGTYALTASGSDGSLTRLATFNLTVTAAATPNFTLSVTPPASIQAGGSGSTTAAAARTGGHTAPITLSLQANAQGISGSGTIATGASSGTLALTVPGAVAAGTYALTANGSDGTLTRQATFNLTVTTAATPNFTLSVAPPASIQAGGAGSATASVIRTGGHTAAITLSLQTNAQGITGSGTIATGAGSGTLTLTVPGAVAAGTYPLTASGSDGTLTRQASFNLTVTSSVPIVVLLKPSAPVLRTGASLAFTATVTGTSNSGINWSLTPASGAGALSASTGPSTTYTAPATVPSGTVTLTAQSQADPSRSDSVAIHVTPANQAPQITTDLHLVNPASGSVMAGTSPTLEIHIAGTGPFQYQWYRNGQKWSPVTEGLNRFTDHMDLGTAPTNLTYFVVVGNADYPLTDGNPCAGVRSQPLSVSVMDTTGSNLPIPGNPITGRVDPAIAPLDAGKLFVSGGRLPNESAGPPVNYDPASNPASYILVLANSGGTLVERKFAHQATNLTSGDILLTGGSNDPGVELYQAGSGELKRIGNLRYPRSRHTAFLIPGTTKVFVVGGVTPDSESSGAGSGAAEPSAELIDVSANEIIVWSARDTSADSMFQFTTNPTVTMEPDTPTASAYVLHVIGTHGSNGRGNGRTTIVTIPKSGLPSASRVTPSGAANLIFSNPHFSTVALGNGQLLLVGVETDGTSALLSGDGTVLTQTGKLNRPRSAAVAYGLPTNKPLVIGGSSQSDDWEEYDPASGTFRTYAAPASAVSGHAVTTLWGGPDSGEVVVYGGKLLSGAYAPNTETFTPNTATYGASLPPTVLVPPASQTAGVGDTVTFGVAVSGSPTMHYTWTRNAAPVGTDSSTLTLSNVQLADSGASITVSVRNAYGTAPTTAPAILTVVNRPIITSFNATPASLCQGASSSLSWSTAGALSVRIDNGVGSVPTTGTATVYPSTTTTYTLVATSGSMTALATRTVQVATGGSQPPLTLSYPTNPATYTTGMAIAANVPTWTGGAPTTWTVTPALPAGLSLNPSTGAITGTPTTATALATYTVKGTNCGGFAQVGLGIRVNSNCVAPSNLRYSQNPAIYVLSAAITPNTPSASGSPATSYSVSPALPAGLSLNAGTGTITGTPTAVSPQTTYTVTENNSCGSTTVGLVITVNLMGVFNYTGSLGTGRQNHTATLLGNGKVLVAGGYNYTSGGYLKSAEVYDPATGTFSTTGSMGTAREYHTATLLNDGTVLIVGGYKGDPYGVGVATAELYNPTTGTFSTLASGTTKWGHTATLLPNGKVLIAGGQIVDTFWNSVALYEPATKTFSWISTLINGRKFHTATLLGNGKVLIAGGHVYSTYLGSGVPSASAEIYDPSATGSSSATSGMSATRSGHCAVRLNDGTVLMTGGVNSSYVIVASAELYNPTGGTFSSTGSMGASREFHTASLLNSGKVLIAGGTSPSTAALASAEIYDATAKIFTTTGSMRTARDNHTATLLNSGKVLIVGGGTYYASSELYQ